MSFPWIRERVENGSTALHGWYFDIDAGELLAYSAETSGFAPLVAKTLGWGERCGVRSRLVRAVCCAG